MTDKRVKKVVIVGGGTAGWMTAAVLSKAIGPTLDVTLIESSEIGIVGVGEATIPQLHHINAFLGIDENEFVRETQGSFKLGIQFEGWGDKSSKYLHAFGDIGSSIGLLGFHHYWLRGRQQGIADDLWQYAVNARAAALNKFGRLNNLGSSRLTGIRHAFHFDASLYGKYLRKYSEKLGVKRVEGKVTRIHQHSDTGMISSVELESGDVHEGDLFVDCSGFRSLLLSETLDVGFDDWSQYLPCDRAVTVASEHATVFRPYTRSIAHPVGWQWQIPLQHRVGNGYVYCSQYINDDEAKDVLLSHLEGAAIGDPRTIRFQTGMREKVWTKNCIAIGLAAGFMEPLESTSIHLIQSGISRLISMFPDLYFDERLIDEYNQQTRFEFERIRDFLILHYHLNRRDEAFWQVCARMAVPDSLTNRMSLFAQTGRIYREADELFTETGWVQVFLGQGMSPERYHPLADKLSDQELSGFFENLDRIISGSVQGLPDHQSFIAENCSARA